MARRIAIIDGHPDSDEQRFIHAIATAYESGARAAGHDVRRIIVSELAFPGLRSSEDFKKRRPPRAIRACQRTIAWADHLVILYPLWLGAMPALLKSFFEQLLRPGFAFKAARGSRMPRKLLKGKSARIVVTMGMPALFYRWYFRAHSLKSLERNILAFCGVHPVRASLLGAVETIGPRARKEWLTKIEALGRRAR
jgi:putative NADPH-quinone reductase